MVVNPGFLYTPHICLDITQLKSTKESQESHKEAKKKITKKEEKGVR